VEPHSEAKTLWCSAGTVFDVIVDLRPDQPTYGTHCAVELAADDGVALHVRPASRTATRLSSTAAELVYLISAPYVSGSARSLRWNDPHLAIPWPLPCRASPRVTRKLPRGHPR
jgi:dTDP-4-dehydrorhamnose 3,5-epimerase